MANLATTFWKGGKLDEAENLEQEVLRVRKEAFGSSHPATINAMANLAATFWKGGKLDEAENLQQEVLRVRREAFRSNHPDTDYAIANLTRIFQKGSSQIKLRIKKWSES
ncbi:hypothetical protein C0993_007379, partial [Termitomyces sp. T159_Od127]